MSAQNNTFGVFTQDFNSFNVILFELLILGTWFLIWNEYRESIKQKHYICQKNNKLRIYLCSFIWLYMYCYNQ